jgi:hypothetical protein
MRHSIPNGWWPALSPDGTQIARELLALIHEVST